MALSWTDFFAQRTGSAVQYFAAPGATRTVMVCSHIWWTEQIALAVLNRGCNLVLHYPLHAIYTDDRGLPKFDDLWKQILGTIREAKVDLILGGNSAAMLVHPETGEMLQDAATQVTGRPLKLVNWWWDEVRTKPPLARAGVSPEGFIKCLANANTINAIWDVDVKEELEAQFGLKNLVHLPLATMPDFWPKYFNTLETRPLAASFLGNCHFTAEWIEKDADPLSVWAREIVRQKMGDPLRPMQKCIEQVTAKTPAAPADAITSRWPTSRHFNGDAWGDFGRPIEFVNAAYMHFTRNRYMQTAENHLRGKFALIGKGWDKLPSLHGGYLRANMEHAEEKSGHVYAQSQICLNLFGGSVHGGLPLRPYDIGASGGLILTHDQRELPSLFEPGRECLAFRTPEEMCGMMDEVRASPARFNEIALAGRRRVLAEHTWEHRMERLFAHVFGA